MTDPQNPVLSAQAARIIQERIAPPPIAEQLAFPAGTSKEARRLAALIRDHQTKKAWILLTITQAMALAMLDRNLKNRKIRRSWVEQIKVILQEGRYSGAADNIVFDTNGRLRNGQHRLIAIAETDIAVETPVMFGLDPAAADSMDIGAKRKAKDFLEFDDIKGGDLLAAVVRLRHRTEHNGATLDEQAVHRLGKAMSEADDVLSRALIAANKLRQHKSRMFSRVTASSVTFAYWKIAKEAQRKLSLDEFWDHLVEGHRLERESAIYKLRNRLSAFSRETGRRKGQYLSQAQVAAWIIQAWNVWQQGDTAIAFRWDEQNRLPTAK